MSSDLETHAIPPKTSQSREYRLTYRDPASGDEYVIRSNPSEWRYKRDALINAGYDVISETRPDPASPWVSTKAAA